MVRNWCARQSRLTQRIDRLVELGWVRREQCPEDRRGTLAVITSEGLAVIEAFAPGHVNNVRELLIGLTVWVLVAGESVAGVGAVTERFVARTATAAQERPGGVSISEPSRIQVIEDVPSTW